MEMGVDHDRDPLDELGRQRVRDRAPLLLELGRRVDHPGVDEDQPVGMVDRVDEPRPRLAVHHDLAAEVRLDIVATDHERSI
jgi:hypothetical protein